MTKEKDALEEGLDHALIAGYLDVKLPGRSRRRRFGPWKSWRRHWVQARLMPDALQDVPAEAVELVLSPARLGLETAVIRVPAGPGSRASVCRTASRSRCHAFVIAAPAEQAEQAEVFLATRSDADTERWMAVLRVAIAGRQPMPTMPTSPRGLSAASAALLRGRRLSRSEGDLLAAPLGALALGLGLQGHPGLPGLPPSSEDLDSPSLCTGLRVPSPAELRARGASAAPAPAKTSTLPRPRPSTSQAGSAASGMQGRQPFRLLYGRRRAETLNAQTCPDKDRLSTSPSQSHSGSALSLLGGKIASGLISAGLGLILSTPGGSEAEDNDVDDDADDGAGVLPAADLPSVAGMAGIAGAESSRESSRAALDRRRESAVSVASVASGIYEEISECGTALAAEAVYENAAATALFRRASNGLENHYEDPTLLRTPRPERGAADAEGEGLPDDGGLDGHAAPPPLPPRQNLTPISELLTRARAPDGGVDADGYVQMGLVRSMVKNAAAKANPPFEFLCAAKCAPGPTLAMASDTEPIYLPMSPIRPPGFEKNRSD
ncbi:uncharacterized protein LOC117646637 [Thrips palmi]|uniref:Uncharacterized protein LOC117646637 n=1 Tax=Thrips palmi TaxID=161013 RepID=A0A6P8Z9D3_THRPL|nr:uncharacterized protein LOC117646637 [Thrips palmi]XP_034243611.1 uncharacterized protein LOC117646637 [Thrips palmi]XP_034243612.1 uncharacterized protein LOC117646637 [Thrips palmi]